MQLGSTLYSVHIKVDTQLHNEVRKWCIANFVFKWL